VCGAAEIKPDVVLFGEMLPPAFAEAEQEAERSDLFLVLGSSLEVYPVADLVPQARRTGARVVLINREPGPFDGDADLVLHAELGSTAARLRQRLRLPAA
jgi:NAD-dependent deacetylase